MAVSRQFNEDLTGSRFSSAGPAFPHSNRTFDMVQLDDARENRTALSVGQLRYCGMTKCFCNDPAPARLPTTGGAFNNR